MASQSWVPSRKRMLLLTVAALVSIGAVVAYIRYFLARPVGSGPAGPAVASEPFQQPWTKRPVLLLGAGDSITAGLGADHPSHSYFNRLAENPADEFTGMKGKSLSHVIPNLQMKNMAISGTTSLEHYNRLKQLGDPQPIDVFGLVVITTGGNDLIHSYGRHKPREGAMYGATLPQAQPWIKNFETRLHAMVDMLMAHFPGGCQIYLADIYDPTDGVGDAPSVYLPDWPAGLAIHAAYNRVLHGVADSRKEVKLTPLHQHFLGHGSHCRQFWREHYQAADPHYWFYQNIEDPNDRGYDAIRRIYLNQITRWLPPALKR